MKARDNSVSEALKPDKSATVLEHEIRNGMPINGVVTKKIQDKGQRAACG
jgi:hypothetical protein